MMRDLQDIIEGLLDMDEETADRAVNVVAAKKLVNVASKKQEAIHYSNMDSYGNKLKEGDLVIGNYVGIVSIGIIIKMTEDGRYCAVDFTGTQSIEDFKTRDGRIRCPIVCHSLIKIPSLKIAKEIIK
jgi:hypothetical protein